MPLHMTAQTIYSTSPRPDKTLVVTCCFNQSERHITFSSCRNVTYNLLRSKIDECFSLNSAAYVLEYQDDDGEVTTICNDADLTDAIHYFDAGIAENASTTSLLSLSSYQSTSASKMVMRLRVAMGYDGPSLSDTASLMSTDDDASMWASSDTPRSVTPDESDTPDSDAYSAASSDQGKPGLPPHDMFERLRRADSGLSAGAYRPSPLVCDDRGVAWLKEQNSRSVQHVLEMLPPSPSSEWSFSLNGSMTSDGLENAWFDQPYTPRGGSRGPPAPSGASPHCPKSTLATMAAVYSSSRTALFPQGMHPMCGGCGHTIQGIMYRCANCPSQPRSYQLCETCHNHWPAKHDTMHIFYKILLTIARPPALPRSVLPTVYKHPSGPLTEIADKFQLEEYIEDITYHEVVCDRCILRIQDTFFRCAFCARDLCSSCEATDKHDGTHVYMVFRSAVNVAPFDPNRSTAQLSESTSPTTTLVHPHSFGEPSSPATTVVNSH